MNFKYNALTAFVLATFVIFAQTAFAQEESAEELTLAKAISSGKVHVALRFRYEQVSQDGFAEDAYAAPLRLRLNYRSASFNNWSAFAEFDYVDESLLNDFNSLSGSGPGRNQFPVVADAKGADVNQLYLDFHPSPKTNVRFGRQRILLDNQRFVGGVGWRQNEQTYDAVSVNFKGMKNTEVFYSYVGTVRRIFGSDVASGRHDTDNHLLNVKVKLSDSWGVTPYLYYIDNNEAAAFSTSTIGARLNGGFALGDARLKFVAEIATQSDIANNPVSYDAEYFNIGATWAMQSGLSLGLAWESLGGDQNVAGASFRTPLATLHAFQGWADKFLGTPDAGIDDVFVTVKYKHGKWNYTGVYHDFSAQSGSADWGSETDISAAYKFGDHYGLLLKAAFYNADQHATDTNKFWIMFTANY